MSRCFDHFALQALHYKEYSVASDVWSFGVVMYEIWSMGHKPFEGIANAKVCFSSSYFYYISKLVGKIKAMLTCCYTHTHIMLASRGGAVIA